jgi:hypothetical protein
MRSEDQLALLNIEHLAARRSCSWNHATKNETPPQWENGVKSKHLTLRTSVA